MEEVGEQQHEHIVCVFVCVCVAKFVFPLILLSHCGFCMSYEDCGRLQSIHCINLKIK